MPDQKAERIVQILKDEVFTVVGAPQKFHSDQGRNFESRLLKHLFGVKKYHTTPYHPMGKAHEPIIVVTAVNMWEEHLQLLLFVYQDS